MNTFRTCLAIGAVLCLSSAARATVIDFNSFHHTDQTMTVASPLTTTGFTFTNDCEDQGRCFEVLGTDFPIPRYNIDMAGAAIWVENPFSTTTFAASNGGTFSFTSIDLAEGDNNGYAPGPGGSLPGTATVMNFTFNYAAGGSSTYQVALDNHVGAQTFVFNQTGLKSVSFVNLDNGGMGWYQFDNVVVTAAAVPEPGSWALMLGGLGALGAAARRRARA